MQTRWWSETSAHFRNFRARQTSVVCHGGAAAVLVKNNTILLAPRTLPHVLVHDSAAVGRAVVHGRLEVGEAAVRLQEETYLRLGPPHSSTHLVVIECGRIAAAATWCI